MNLFTEHAREVVKMPPEWDAFKWEAIGRESASTAAKLFIITGAVAPIKTRGKYKGHQNWDKLKKDTLRTAYFTPDEHEVWLLQWEHKTGLCAECLGRGERSVGWSVSGGTRYKPCEKCRATGRWGCSG